MSFLAPYNSYMRLGSGFNSYTQEVCLQDAVLINTAQPAPPPSPTPPKTTSRPKDNVIQSGPSVTSLVALLDTTKAAEPLNGANPTGSPAPLSEGPATLTPAAGSCIPAPEETPPERNQNQIVTYSSRMVDNIADIVDALNISTSNCIKYGTIKGSGSASFVNENKVNQSDINCIITVKVTNHDISVAQDRMVFNPMANLDPAKFTEVYGDCFVSGFVEGGEFTAIVSIKVGSKSKVAAVKAAAEAEIAIAAVPGLSIGTKNNLDKKKSSVWDDTETTISVNWSGGGEVKPQNQKWDLATVVDVANRFPNLVEYCAERTSAILTSYTCLRTFHEENAKLGSDKQFVIKRYELCSLYTQDLYNSYMAYKEAWTQIADAMKYPEKYREREKSEKVPFPVELTPKSLNEARLLARKGLVKITDESARLVTNPELADVQANGELRPLPVAHPGELVERLPIRLSFHSVREQLNPKINGPSETPLSAEEIAAIDQWAGDETLSFSPLIGGPQSSCWINKSKNRIFCTLDQCLDSSNIEDLSGLRLHGHEHHRMDLLANAGNRSRTSEGCLSALGFSVRSDAKTRAAADRTHKHVGRPNDNSLFWSSHADLSISTVVKIIFEYERGSGRIAALTLLDADNNEITSWKQYGQAKSEKPPGLTVEEQYPPGGRGSWALCGFWGHSDAIVITRLGAIWKKV